MKAPIVRDARPEDREAIERCHAQVEARLGRKMDLPAIDDPCILEFLVAEIDGEIIGFHYQEKCIEMCHGGVDPRATAAFRAHQMAVLASAAAAGVRFVHSQMPIEVPEVGKHLEDSGFQDVSDKYRHYVLDLR